MRSCKTEISTHVRSLLPRSSPFCPGCFRPGPRSAAAPAIVYPPDRALLSGDGSLDLLGFLPGGAPGSVTITGKSGSRSQPVGAGAFTVKVKLDPGENTLVLQDRKVTVFLVGRRLRDGSPGLRSARHPRRRQRLRGVPRLFRRGGHAPRETAGALRALSRRRAQGQGRQAAGRSPPSGGGGRLPRLSRLPPALDQAAAGCREAGSVLRLPRRLHRRREKTDAPPGGAGRMHRLPRRPRRAGEETAPGHGDQALPALPRRPVAGQEREGVGGAAPGARRRVPLLPPAARLRRAAAAEKARGPALRRLPRPVSRRRRGEEARPPQPGRGGGVRRLPRGARLRSSRSFSRPRARRCA